jgi:hypothetical protein
MTINSEVSELSHLVACSRRGLTLGCYPLACICSPTAVGSRPQGRFSFEELARTAEPDSAGPSVRLRLIGGPAGPARASEFIHSVHVEVGYFSVTRPYNGARLGGAFVSFRLIGGRIGLCGLDGARHALCGPTK